MKRLYDMNPNELEAEIRIARRAGNRRRVRELIGQIRILQRLAENFRKPLPTGAP